MSCDGHRADPLPVLSEGNGMTPTRSIESADRAAETLDDADPPLGDVGPARGARILVGSTLTEDPGSIPFDELLGPLFRPRGVRDRIVLPARSPLALDETVARLIAGSAGRIGRHNRYVPVPGERRLRDGDLLDFLTCYGHEYQIAVFRAVDIRTGSALDVESLTAEAVRQGARPVWDWTGAFDWLPLSAIPEEVPLVFWSRHLAFHEAEVTEPGFWTPPSSVTPSVRRLEPFSAAAVQRTGRLSRFFAELVGSIASPERITVLHPADEETRLPVVVLDVHVPPEAVTASLLQSPAIEGVATYGERISLLPSARRARFGELVRVARELAAIGRRGEGWT